MYWFAHLCQTNQSSFLLKWCSWANRICFEMFTLANSVFITNLYYAMMHFVYPFLYLVIIIFFSSTLKIDDDCFPILMERYLILHRFVKVKKTVLNFFFVGFLLINNIDWRYRINFNNNWDLKVRSLIKYIKKIILVVNLHASSLKF